MTRYVSQKKPQNRGEMPTFPVTPKGPHTLELISVCEALEKAKSLKDFQAALETVGGAEVLREKIEENQATVEFSENERVTETDRENGRTRTKVGPKIKRNGKVCLDPANAAVWAGARHLKHASTDPDYEGNPKRGLMVARMYPAGYVPQAFMRVPALAPQILNVVDAAQKDYAAQLAEQDTSEAPAGDGEAEGAGVGTPAEGSGDGDFPPIA